MNREKGSLLEPTLILVALSVLLIFFILPTYGQRGPARSIYSLADGTSQAGNNTIGGRPGFQGDSFFSRAVSLSTGNAAYENEPAEEYIVIENRGTALINITGWKLTNNKGERTAYPSDSAAIPQGAAYISPSGFHAPQNIILRPGDQAIVTTGSPGQRTPYPLTSFKENKCSGYLGSLRGYEFTPSLARSCPRPSLEPGFSTLDLSCRRFIEGMGSCHTPEVNSNNNVVDGRENLSYSCVAFIKERYNYAGCIARHKDDPDFYGRTWRVYLGKQWEMWAPELEIISLFDQFGKLVDANSY